MNILYMKYAVDVARIGSVNKASEQLFIAQPNLSRCIRSLEADLGIVIFDRSFKGMQLTPEGEEFIRYAEIVLNQIDDIERKYKSGVPIRQRFSISVPRASYIADAFARFTRSINANPAEMLYMETNSSKAIDNILNSDYRLGIVRYAAKYDNNFKELLCEKGLEYEVVSEFKYVLVMSRESALASKPEIRSEDLIGLIEIAHGDPYVPSLPASVVKKDELSESIERRILLFERGGQFDILAENPETFMWVSPIPQKLLERYDLVQRECIDSNKPYRDLLIYRKDYALTELDKCFITELCNSKHKTL